MPSPTNELTVLIVEDDKFKLNRVEAHLRGLLGDDARIVSCEAMSTAASALAGSEFDIVIIDMSIPSHPTAAGAGSPRSFPSGGLDVLFNIADLGHKSLCIVLTQYPEIEMEGELVPVKDAAAAITEKFGIRVEGCVQYFEDGSEWKLAINKSLGLE